jgi:hypothetical protein
VVSFTQKLLHVFLIVCFLAHNIAPLCALHEPESVDVVFYVTTVGSGQESHIELERAHYRANKNNIEVLSVKDMSLEAPRLEVQPQQKVRLVSEEGKIKFLSFKTVNQREYHETSKGKVQSR